MIFSIINSVFYVILFLNHSYFLTQIILKNNEFRMKNYDIVVVGAGPGGSIAAKVASENGYSTCLIEKESLAENGRYKACGGAMAWELIEEINYPEDKIGRVIESLELHHVDGEDFSKKGKGAVVWRDVFDKFLTNLATESGAILKDSEQLIKIEEVKAGYHVSTRKDEYNAKYVIAADGVSSPTLKLLDWPFFKSQDVILTITKEMNTTKSYIDKILGKDTVHLFFGIKNLIPVG